MMEEAFRLIDDPNGESTYLRLSTRSIRQVERGDDDWRDGALAGGYWLREPGPSAEAAIVAMGAVMPEALAAWEELRADIPGLGLLAVTSPDLLHRGWTARPGGALAGRAQAEPRRAIAVAALAPGAGLVTIADAAPAVAVVARRRARPARRAARRREVRPDRQPRRPLRRLPPRRRRDHRGRRGDIAPKRRIKPLFTQRRLRATFGIGTDFVDANRTNSFWNEAAKRARGPTARASPGPPSNAPKAQRPIRRERAAAARRRWSRPTTELRLRLAEELEYARRMLDIDGRRAGVGRRGRRRATGPRCNRSTSSARCSATSPTSIRSSDPDGAVELHRHVPSSRPACSAAASR